MMKLELPLKPLVLSIGSQGEPGPRADFAHEPLCLDHARVTPDLIQQIAPDHVVGWLFCEGYDAYDLGRTLSLARFQGVFHAAAPRLPRKTQVMRELGACFPDLDFRLICPAELTRRVARYCGMVAEAGSRVAALPA